MDIGDSTMILGLMTFKNTFTRKEAQAVMSLVKYRYLMAEMISNV
jgi:hypothetical protein